MTDIFIEVKAKSYRELCDALGIPEDDIFVEYPEYGLKITAEEQEFIRTADFGSITTIVCTIAGGVANVVTVAALLYDKLKKSRVADRVEVIRRETVELDEEHFLEALKKLSQSSLAQTTNASVPSSPIIPELIQQLAVLHATGALTDEEFATKKAELLTRM